MEQSHPQRTVTRVAVPLETNDVIATAITNTTTAPAYENNVPANTNEMASTSTSTNDNTTMK